MHYSLNLFHLLQQWHVLKHKAPKIIETKTYLVCRTFYTELDDSQGWRCVCWACSGISVWLYIARKIRVWSWRDVKFFHHTLINLKYTTNVHFETFQKRKITVKAANSKTPPNHWYKTRSIEEYILDHPSLWEMWRLPLKWVCRGNMEGNLIFCCKDMTDPNFRQIK